MAKKEDDAPRLSPALIETFLYVAATGLQAHAERRSDVGSMHVAAKLACGCELGIGLDSRATNVAYVEPCSAFCNAGRDALESITDSPNVKVQAVREQPCEPKERALN